MAWFPRRVRVVGLVPVLLLGVALGQGGVVQNGVGRGAAGQDLKNDATGDHKSATNTASQDGSKRDDSKNDNKTAAANPALAAADQLARAGKFAEAETAYRALLRTDGPLVPAQVGLVRALLRQQKVEEALESVNAALTAVAILPSLLAAKGEVQFRRGEMAEAEKSFADAKELDAKEVHAYLGLARLYRAESLYRQAYDELQSAHRIAPDDPDVQRAWLNILPRSEAITALQAYLAGPHPEDEDETRWLTERLDFLKATAGQPVHACRLVSRVERTDATLYTVRNASGARSGIGLTVQLNGQNFNLQFDTGASGLIVNRKVAEKANLTRISALHLAGIGDKGLQSGYTTVADRIRIGELEFQDCVVAVTEQNSITEDGLIGADVFARYLVDIDLPGMKLALSPLPKRPEDTTVPTSLNSEGEEPTANDPKENSDSAATEKQPTASRSSAVRHLPKDRYIAPEMAKWTKVFRFGHTLLVPTNVNDSETTLFGLDTGAFDNILSVHAVRQVAKVKSAFGLRVQGMSGDVKKVYHAKVTLRFGHLQQSDIDTIALDLSKISRQTGTEVSGFLGFGMLQMLDVKLDYRDGLVDLEFDPKRVQHLLK